eukprot:TRINITY_DN3882_c0_g1_i1.p1 TRINITY_DN3882_c0_g1~~TRINITY_DN3882_c0_g1_i1.p1  ORF type:complete len:394 (-),score=55.61 TRINITY_DN3882_c0_g1_i1:587-1768(-)
MPKDKHSNSSASDDDAQHSCWASMPAELMRDVIARVESSESQWPGRSSVVACGAVCQSWREITRELVKTPEQSGRLTFPISLKQPGPRDTPMQCFIKRDRTNNSYSLYLGIPPASIENGKFLLAARRCRRAASTDYIISLDGEEMSRGAATYVGKLRSNFLGTKFTIFDSQPQYNAAKGSARPKGKQVSPRIPAGSYPVAHIAYELNVLGTRGPRRMQVTLHSTPASCMETGGTVHYPMDFANLAFEEASWATSVTPSGLSPKTKAGAVADCGSCGNSDCDCALAAPLSPGGSNPLVLKNKAPRWHEQLQCWCLNFKGRVTVASVKNFQLVAVTDPLPADKGATSSGSDHDKVLLQFGKIGKDQFTMDYRYPLSAFQAFAICLSSFDTKLACE